MSGAGAAGWLSLTGSAFQQRAQIENDKAVNLAKTQEMLRQSEFAKQAGDITAKGVKQSGSEAAKKYMAEGQAKRQGAFDNIQKVQLLNQVGGMQPADQLRVTQTGKNRAILGSYGDWALRDLIGKIQIQNELNKLYGTAQGQQDIVAPYLENQAARSSDKWKMVGAAIQGGGDVVGAYSGSQAGQQVSKAPTYVNDGGAWSSGQNEDYLKFSNVD